MMQLNQFDISWGWRTTYNVQHPPIHIQHLRTGSETGIDPRGKNQGRNPKVESLRDPHPTQAMDAAGNLDRHWYDIIKYR